jgi:hypothetical protein
MSADGKYIRDDGDALLRAYVGVPKTITYSSTSAPAEAVKEEASQT